MGVARTRRATRPRRRTRVLRGYDYAQLTRRQ